MKRYYSFDELMGYSGSKRRVIRTFAPVDVTIGNTSNSMKKAWGSLNTNAPGLGPSPVRPRPVGPDPENPYPPEGNVDVGKIPNLDDDIYKDKPNFEKGYIGSRAGQLAGKSIKHIEKGFRRVRRKWRNPYNQRDSTSEAYWDKRRKDYEDLYGEPEEIEMPELPTDIKMPGLPTEIEVPELPELPTELPVVDSDPTLPTGLRIFKVPEVDPAYMGPEGAAARAQRIAQLKDGIAKIQQKLDDDWGAKDQENMDNLKQPRIDNKQALQDELDLLEGKLDRGALNKRIAARIAKVKEYYRGRIKLAEKEVLKITDNLKKKDLHDYIKQSFRRQQKSALERLENLHKKMEAVEAKEPESNWYDVAPKDTDINDFEPDDIDFDEPEPDVPDDHVMDNADDVARDDFADPVDDVIFDGVQNGFDDGVDAIVDPLGDYLDIGGDHSAKIAEFADAAEEMSAVADFGEVVGTALGKIAPIFTVLAAGVEVWKFTERKAKEDAQESLDSVDTSLANYNKGVDDIVQKYTDPTEYAKIKQYLLDVQNPDARVEPKHRNPLVKTPFEKLEDMQSKKIGKDRGLGLRYASTIGPGFAEWLVARSRAKNKDEWPSVMSAAKHFASINPIHYNPKPNEQLMQVAPESMWQKAQNWTGVTLLEGDRLKNKSYYKDHKLYSQEELAWMRDSLGPYFSTYRELGPDNVVNGKDYALITPTADKVTWKPNTNPVKKIHKEVIRKYILNSANGNYQDQNQDWDYDPDNSNYDKDMSYSAIYNRWKKNVDEAGMSHEQDAKKPDHYIDLKSYDKPKEKPPRAITLTKDLYGH